MTTELKVLNVFLASPGDLPDERSKAKEVVDELNQTARLLGWRIELLGWEDVAPGYVRPQSKINEHVDTCNLFVGLLYKRWGQPTGVAAMVQDSRRNLRARLREGSKVRSRRFGFFLRILNQSNWKIQVSNFVSSWSSEQNWNEKRKCSTSDFARAKTGQGTFVPI